jgi:hypothetical protein
MKIFKVISHLTSSVDAVTEVNELVGEKMPRAILLNYGNFGYAKF